MATLEHDQICASVVSEESQLGRWTHAHWSPSSSSPLSGVVERIWYFEGTLTHARERVFPDATAELIVMLDEPHRDGDTLPSRAFPAVCMNGLRTRSSVVVAPPGHCRVLGIRFDPVGSCLLLRGSIKGLLDVTIDLRDALGRVATELGERCADARWAVEIVRVAAVWTLNQIDRDLAPDATMRYAVSAIQSAKGFISIDRVSSQSNMSRSRFAHRFRDRFGVTPKRFARIIRFHGALSRLQYRPSLAEAAAELGYYDQAHLYRDFSEFAGMTPGDFIAANRYPGSPSIAEP